MKNFYKKLVFIGIALCFAWTPHQSQAVNWNKLLGGTYAVLLIGGTLQNIYEIYNHDTPEELNKLLLKAITKNNEYDVAFYLSKGADINAKDSTGSTSLHHACWHGYDKIVTLLLNYGNIDINAKKNDGWTPLHDACYCNSTNIVKLLVQHGINIRAKDRYNGTACDVAQNHNTINLLTNAENELTSFIKNPFQNLTQIKSPTTGLSKLHLARILYNLEKSNITYKEFMYWFSKIYLNRHLIDLTALIDKCKTYKGNKELIVNAHNFPKNSYESTIQNNFLGTLYNTEPSQKKPNVESDIRLIYK